jgi:hypothetical protein
MQDDRFTATQIAEILAAALEVQEEDKENLHHRVRYLAKKHYLHDGRKIDKRGTLAFPVSEVFRAALFCEFLAFTIDVKVAAAALKQAQAEYRPGVGNYPVSAKKDGGWAFSDVLNTARQGIRAGEDWWLIVELRRSGTSDGAGLVGRFAHSEEERTDVDAIFGRAPAATVLRVSLTKLYGNILKRL